MLKKKQWFDIEKILWKVRRFRLGGKGLCIFFVHFFFIFSISTKPIFQHHLILVEKDLIKSLGFNNRM